MRTLTSKLAVGLSLLVLLLVGLALFASVTSAAQPDGLFVDTGKKALATKAPGPTVVRSRNVELRLNLFNSSVAPSKSKVALAATKTIPLNLFPDVSLTATLDRIQLRPNGFSWIGRVSGMTPSSVIFVQEKGVLSGSIVTPKATYTVRYAGNGVHTVSQINPKAFPEEAKSLTVDKSKLTAPAAKSKKADSAANIDVLVLYTPAARTALGGDDAGARTAIEAARVESNLVVDNSGVTPHFTVVTSTLTNYTESGDFDTDLSRLQNPSDGYMDEAAVLRAKYGADIVTLVMVGTAYCGVAYDIMNPVTTAFAPYAFDLVATDCLTGNYSFVHEIAHLMSARHDWTADPTDNAPFTYNHGYVLPSLSGRTVMAYSSSCSGCPRLPYFSNPDLTYTVTSEALGVPEGTTHAADNRKTLNNTADTVANFVQAVTTTVVPAAPTLVSPSGTITTTQQPTFTWNVSSGATWYSLWVDGPSGTPIQQWYEASKVCNSTTCSVPSPAVLANGQYTWYALAWNLAGSSAWSSSLTFTINGTPGVPTLISPSGTVTSPVTFLWYSIANATEYKLNINSTSNTVASSSCSGSTCATSLSLGGGTYPWTVQACNTSGCSANSSPFTITIPITAPVVPTAIAPTGAISTTQPTFVWTQVATATTYTVWITGTGGYENTFNLTANASLCPSGSNCSFPAPAALAPGTYTWQVRACNGSACGAWSNQLTFTLSTPTTCVVTQISPSGTITNTQPTFRWSYSGTCTSFYLWVTGVRADSKWINKDASECAGNTCSWTPDWTYANGSYAWWVYGYPNGQWTGPMNFQISSVVTEGFTSPPWTTWQGTSGTWITVGTPPNDWFYTQGVPGKFASAAYPGSYANLDYEVKLFRYGCSWCAHGIDVRGTPGSPDGGWMNAYQFEINRNGYFSVWRGINNNWTALQYWTYSPAIIKGDNWNTMRVLMIGSNMYLYLNGTLIWSGSDSNLTSGQVGAFIARPDPKSTNDALILASAKLTIPTTALQVRGDVTAEQSKLNADANKNKVGTTAGGPQ